MGNEFIPYTHTEPVQITVTSANADRQLYRAPWPLGQYVELESIQISDVSSSGGQVILWDQDLSNTTPTSRGSAGGFLAVFGIPGGGASGVVANTVVYPSGDLITKTRFYAGIAFQASRLNMHIAAQIRIRR